MAEKPEYHVYRARRGFLSRFLNRDGGRFDRLKAGGDEAGVAAPPRPPGTAPGTAPGTREPPEPLIPRTRPREIPWKRILRWVLIAIPVWALFSLVLFMISAHIQSTKVPDRVKRQLDDSGNMVTSANNILVLGSDRRPGEPGPSRADTIMLMRYGGGHAARLSIPRDTLVDIPGVGPQKVNAAYAFGGPALMIKTLKQYLGIEINHIVEVDFTGFPKFVDALGGVNMTFEHCIVSRFEGKTHRFHKGKNHLSGEQALDVVRIRKNRCAPEESDLTRARRQQQFLNAVKKRLFNPLIFPRWPWVAWRAPRAIRSDMAGPALLALFFDTQIGGSLEPTLLRPIDPGANPLQVSDAEKQAAVKKFLKD